MPNGQVTQAFARGVVAERRGVAINWAKFAIDTWYNRKVKKFEILVAFEEGSEEEDDIHLREYEDDEVQTLVGEGPNHPPSTRVKCEVDFEDEAKLSPTNKKEQALELGTKMLIF